MKPLTILCVTKGDDYARRFLEHMEDLAFDACSPFVIACDGEDAYIRVSGWGVGEQLLIVESAGYIESVLDEAIAVCDDGYVLRLDDDEKVSEGLRQWLLRGDFRRAEHWCFPRVHLYGDAKSMIVSQPFYPDLQTRLSVKEKSGGRHEIHVGSPFGPGIICQHPIEHHKFLVRPVEERRRLVSHYSAIADFAGSSHYAAFSLPEEVAGLIVEPYRAKVAA